MTIRPAGLTLPGRPAPSDGLANTAGAILSLSLAGLLLALLMTLIWQGANQLSPDFLFSAPQAGGRAGGISSILVSTAMILLVCLSALVPLGLASAILVTQWLPRGSFLERITSYSMDVLSAVPSIVFALFGYQFFAVTLGLGFSILAGGLTLACMSLPLMIRGTEQALRGIPDELHQASAALGLSTSGMLWKVLLPSARHGIAAAIILSIGRALAETAVLLFTAGYVLRMPSSVMDSGRALSVHIYDLAMHVPGGEQRAAATAIVLVSLIILINLAVHRLLRTSEANHAR